MITEERPIFSRESHCEVPGNGDELTRESHWGIPKNEVELTRESHCEVPGNGDELTRESHCEVPGNGDELARESHCEVSGNGDELTRESHCEVPGNGDELARESHWGIPKNDGQLAQETEFFGLEQIEKTFGGDRLYDHFSLSLPKRGIIAVTGPSGCGKTTFLRVLAGLAPVEGGRVFGLNGHRITFLFQEDRLFPWLTVEKNIQMVLRSFCGRKEMWRRIEAALNLVELSDAGRMYPGELSGGMRRRVALARALAYDGDVILMDEPFTALDKALRDRLFSRLLEEFRRKNKTVLLVTHEEGEAALADWRLELSGRPVFGIFRKNR